MDGAEDQPNNNNPFNRKGSFGIRYENLMKKFEDFVIENPGPAELRRFAEHLGLSANYMTQLKAGTKVIGERAARKLEKALNVEPGWLDHEHHEWRPRDRFEQETFAIFHKLLRDLPKEKRKPFMIAVRRLYKVIKKQNDIKKK